MLGRLSLPLILVLGVCAGPARSAELRKGPYLIYGGAEGEMTVLWQTDGPAETVTIQFGDSPALGSEAIEVTPHGDHQFQYTIRGLQPGNDCHYRVDVDGLPYDGRFRTAPGDGAALSTLYVYGDSRSRPQRHDRVASAMLRDIDAAPGERLSLILHTGDWVEMGASERQWQEQVFNRDCAGLMRLQASLPIMGARGNHDMSVNLLNKYLPYPVAEDGASYYSFDHGLVHVAVVDDYSPVRAGSAQRVWLEADLAATDRPWKIVVFHEPAYSTGGMHPNSVVNQTLTTELLEPLGVDLVLAGHNHYYARHLKDGVVHVTTGGGGAPLARPRTRAAHHAASARALHFVRLEASIDRLLITAIDDHDRVIDEAAVEPSAGALGP